jgi:hypothetical protein
MPTEPWYVDDSFCLGAWNNVLLMVWGGDMRGAHIKEIRRCNERLLKGYSAALGFTVFAPAYRLPGAAIRAESEQLSRELLPSSLGSANVVLGEGLRIATLRTVLTAVLMASRSGKPNKVFGHIEDAAEWAVNQPSVDRGTGNPYHGLLDAARALRKIFP